MEKKSKHLEKLKKFENLGQNIKTPQNEFLSNMGYLINQFNYSSFKLKQRNINYMRYNWFYT